ncbi:efflux RND transporter permease subunit [Calditrichota bacterium]
MKFTKLALDNHQFTVVILVLLVLYGAVSYLGMPRSEDPYMEPPFANVVVILPGASPEDMENLILDPLDDRIRDIKEVEHTFGSCRDGVAFLEIEFEAGVDQSEMIAKAEEKLADAKIDFPPGVARAEVQAWSTFHVKMMQLAIVSETRSLREMENWADKFESKLQRVPGLREFETFGTRSEEVRISIDPEKLAALSIPIERISGAIESSSMNIPGGSIDIGDRKFNIRTTGDFESVRQIGRVVVGGSAVSPVYLSEVADIEFKEADRTYLTRVNAVPSILLTARLKPGYNVSKVMARVHQIVDELSTTLPRDIETVWVFDQSEAVSERLNNFFRNLWQGIILVGIIVLVALGFRPATVVMLAIPFSFIIATGLIAASGFAVHQMTIAAYIISLGLLVDNGIVVTENINTFLLKGIGRKKAAYEGTAQVGWAVVASTATTVLAFLPIAMMKDTSGDFIRSMPISVMFILAASLLVALTASPMFAVKVMRPATFEQQPFLVRKLHDFVNCPYKRILAWSLNNRWKTIVIATVTLFASMALFPLVGVSFFPKAEKPLLLVSVVLPRGSSLDATDKILQKVEGELINDSNVTLVSANLGRGQPSIYYNIVQRQESSNYGQLLVHTRKECCGEELMQFAERLRTKFDRYPGARILVEELEQGPGGGTPIALRIYGEDLQTLEDIAGDVEKKLKTIPGAVNVDNPLGTKSIDLKIDIDRDKAALLGMQLHQVDIAIRTAIAGWEAGTYRDSEGEEYPIMVRLPAGEHAGIEDFSRIYLPTASGRQIQLAEVAEIKLESGHSMLLRRDGNRMAGIYASSSGRATAEIEQDILTYLADKNLPNGYHYELGGDSEARGESFSSMYRATVIAIVGIYGVLVLMFRSFRQPLIIYAALPLAFIGSVFALLITGNSFSFTAFVGLTSLVGIVVNNSILLVDMSNKKRSSGLDMRDSIIEAGTGRFIPIVLTTMTTVLGLLPLTLTGGTMWAPMGWVIIGGLITSTALTLVVVPVLYEFFTDKTVAN